MSKLRDHRRRAKHQRTLAKLTEKARSAAVNQVLTDLYDRHVRLERTCSVRHAAGEFPAIYPPYVPYRRIEITEVAHQMSFRPKGQDWTLELDFLRTRELVAFELAKKLLDIGAIRRKEHFDGKTVTLVWDCLIGRDTYF